MGAHPNSRLGQVPLVLGPGSWGFPGLLPAQAPARLSCPAGTFVDVNGLCRPRTAMGGGITLRVAAERK